jgi:hypothetical protein
MRERERERAGKTQIEKARERERNLKMKRGSMDKLFSRSPERVGEHAQTFVRFCARPLRVKVSKGERERQTRRVR